MAKQHKNKTALVLFQALCGSALLASALSVHAAISSTGYDYDVQNGITTVTDANSKRIISYYDAVNRLDRIELPDMAGGTQTFDFGYDDTDQLTSASYPGGSQNFTYDELDRLETLSEFNITGLLKLFHDHQDRITQITYGANGSGGAVCYQYDPDGRITRVGRVPAGQTISTTDPVDCKNASNVEKTDYSYDAKGRLATRTYPNGVKTYWDYNTTTGQLKETGHKQANGTLIYSDTFTYYPGTSLHQTISHTTAQGVTTTRYDYDAWQRLTTVTEADGRKTVFQYDPFGNRTNETITNINNPGASGGTPKPYGAYRYGYDGNRLQTIYYTAPAAAEQLLEQFTYDSVGRIKTRNHSTNGLTTYSWDDRGYLIKLEKPGTTISYSYNALGARTSKSVNGVTTRYVTAPVFGMNHMLMELDGNNNVTARYVYGGHEQLIAEPSPGNSANDQYLLHGGSVGNVTHAVSRSGAVQTESSYDAFGNRTLVSGSSATRFGYTGEESDAESGLLYLRARYYDPVIGRFISVDPYLGRLAEPATQNRYVYVYNKPLNFVDPSGLDGMFVYFNGYSVDTGLGFNLPLGHAGVVAIDDKTGQAQYFQFGRYGGEYGDVQGPFAVGTVSFDQNGEPTRSSKDALNQRLIDTFAKDKSETVTTVYNVSADANKIVDFAMSRKGNEQNFPYTINPFSSNPINTCINFAADALSAGMK